MPLAYQHQLPPQLLFNDSRTSDFVVVAQNKDIYVHRSLLRVHSRFMRDFLDSDPSCTRINANNAVYEAMVIVLKSMYENPPPNIFGSLAFNFSVVLSTFEIAMHFILQDMAFAAVTQLLTLIDRCNVVRTVKAALKHVNTSLAQRVLEQCKRHLPPDFSSSSSVEAPLEEWERIKQRHPALAEAEAQAVARGSGASHTTTHPSASASLNIISSTSSASPNAHARGAALQQQRASSASRERERSVPLMPPAAEASVSVASPGSRRGAAAEVRERYLSYLTRYQSERANSSSPQQHVASSADAAASFFNASGVSSIPGVAAPHHQQQQQQQNPPTQQPEMTGDEIRQLYGVLKQQVGAMQSSFAEVKTMVNEQQHQQQRRSRSRSRSNSNATASGGVPAQEGGSRDVGTATGFAHHQQRDAATSTAHSFDKQRQQEPREASTSTAPVPAFAHCEDAAVQYSRSNSGASAKKATTTGTNTLALPLPSAVSTSQATNTPRVAMVDEAEQTSIQQQQDQQQPPRSSHTMTHYSRGGSQASSAVFYEVDQQQQDRQQGQLIAFTRGSSTAATDTSTAVFHAQGPPNAPSSVVTGGSSTGSLHHHHQHHQHQHHQDDVVGGIDVSPQRQAHDDDLVDGYNRAVVAPSGSKKRRKNEESSSDDGSSGDGEDDAGEEEAIDASAREDRQTRQLMQLQEHIASAKAEYQEELRKWKAEKEQLQANIHKSEANDPLVRSVVEARDANKRELQATTAELEELAEIKAQVMEELDENDKYAVYTQQYCDAAGRAQNELAQSLLAAIRKEVEGSAGKQQFALNRVRRLLGQQSVKARDERNALVERMRTVEESNERLEGGIDEEEKKIYELRYLLDRYALA